MKRALTLFCLWILAVHGVETDYDYVVVGTSPISLFEAIYRTCQGNRVLVVEQAAECGGAWKSITICGIPHVDLGCHEFGKDARVQQFLEQYAGCTIIQNAPRDGGKSAKNWGIYPAGGCYELTHNLELLMEAVGTKLLLNSRLESVYVDTAREIAEVKINGKIYTTPKVVVTGCSDVRMENTWREPVSNHSKYPHIYILIADATPTRFTYAQPGIRGVSRVMNVSQFLGLEETGLQLIAMQIHGESFLQNGPKYFEELKKLKLIDASAELLRTENYIYEQVTLDRGQLQHAFFEILDTSHIANIGSQAEKWKTSMRPWNEIMAKTY
jgi:hypothetical protein